MCGLLIELWQKYNKILSLPLGFIIFVDVGGWSNVCVATAFSISNLFSSSWDCAKKKSNRLPLLAPTFFLPPSSLVFLPGFSIPPPHPPPPPPRPPPITYTTLSQPHSSLCHFETGKSNSMLWKQISHICIMALPWIVVLQLPSVSEFINWQSKM